MKNKITDMFLNKSWKRILIVFIVIFILIFTIGVVSVNYVSNVIDDERVHSEIINVTDKLQNNDSDHYIIIGDNNKTYSISHDNYGKKMFSSIEIGQKYDFIVRDPPVDDGYQPSHILKVENVTS